jgi:hypothetical protein
MPASLPPAGLQPKEPPVRPSRIAIAVLLDLVGIVWLLQGLGVIGGSVMSGDPVWAVIGGALLVLSSVVLVREARRGRAGR